MNAQQIANTLEEMATLLDLKGENPFRVRAYQNAARLLLSTKLPLDELIAAAREHKIKGLGEHLTDAIASLYETDALPSMEELRAEFPESLFDLLKVPGLGAKKVKVLYEQLQISSLKQLEQACVKGQLAKLKGFGQKTAENILQGIQRLESYGGKFLFLEAKQLADVLISNLRSSGLAHHIEVAGSIRRKKEIVKDIDIVATSKTATKLIDAFCKSPLVSSITAQGETKSSVILESGIAADLRVVSDKEFVPALVYFTGSKEHNTSLRSLAKNRGFKLNEYGLFRGSRAMQTKSEEDVYQHLGLAFIPPELREDQGEIEFAELANSGKRAFPTLVSETDIKGILHAHTTYSDGKCSLSALAQAVKDRGYQYLGVTDHSQSAAYAGGLKPDAIKRQHEEIDSLNQQLHPFVIFKGIESDILADGELDYPERILESFDFIIASVHSKFNLSEREMTNRIIKAVKNPFTTILGHVTGRLLLQREGYPVDVFAVLEACRTYHTAIELNANPRRLDLDWRYLKHAKELGIPIPITPDAHAIEQIDFTNTGVGFARKGWLTKEDILNSLTSFEITTFFRKKKEKREKAKERTG